MHYLVRFWFVVLASMTGLVALGFLTLSFLFPDTPLFDVTTVERLLVVLLAAVSLGVVVWSSTTFGDGVEERPR